MTEELPAIALRRGGWFVTTGARGWSGPWASEEAATLALGGDYEAAHHADRAARSPLPPPPLEGMK